MQNASMHNTSMHAPCMQGRYIHEATKAIPIIGDGDTGYGNAMNVKRTVKGYAAAGFAGEREPAVGSGCGWGCNCGCGGLETVGSTLG